MKNREGNWDFLISEHFVHFYVFVFGLMGFGGNRWEWGGLCSFNLFTVGISFFLNLVVQNLLRDCNRTKLHLRFRIQDQ